MIALFWFSLQKDVTFQVAQTMFFWSHASVWSIEESLGEGGEGGVSLSFEVPDSFSVRGLLALEVEIGEGKGFGLSWPKHAKKLSRVKLTFFIVPSDKESHQAFLDASFSFSLHILTFW